MLDENLNALLSDFNTAACLGQPAVGYERPTHFLPRDPSDPNTVLSDLFAFGSTLYEPTHGKVPYGELYPHKLGSLDSDAYDSYCRHRDQIDQGRYGLVLDTL
jgi:hypothetical protein